MNEDCSCLRKDGSVFYADIAGHPILYEGRPFRLPFSAMSPNAGNPRQHCDKATTSFGPSTTKVVDGIIIVDTKTWIPIRVNLAFCRMLSYSEEELKTITPARIHPPEVLPLVQEHCRID